MDISAKTDYAIRALIALAEADTGEVSDTGAAMSTDVLAQRQGLPRKFLEAILSDLRRGGLVMSVRGSHGGYRLARPAAEITLGSVFRVVDGPLAEVRGLRPQDLSYAGSARHLPTVWIAVRASLRRVLDDVTLADVTSGDLPAHVAALANTPGAWSNR
ncbi:MAG: Rrf2 family transcriptional regulator [Tetrasphaera sp.]|jgi:Rrf2 family protein|nr:Rrf2 family transcriptional regulator [Tetrasphaera sp.]